MKFRNIINKSILVVIIMLLIVLIISCDQASLSISTSTTTLTTTEEIITDCDIDTTYEGGYELIFCDSFSEETLNLDYWTASDELRGGSKVTYYSDRYENLHGANDKLIFTAIKLDYRETYLFGNVPYTSARIESRYKFDFKYGRVLVRAKVAPGAGTWPAIWMMSTNQVFGTWPRSGEIDIMEYLGRKPGVVTQAYHTEKYNHMNTNLSVISGSTFLDSPETTFHDFELIWTSESLTWKVDGKTEHYYRFNNRLEADNENISEAWPFDQEFYLILNLGLGDSGGYAAGEIDPDVLPSTFEVEYVKVYQINYDKYDLEFPTTVDYVEHSKWNPLYFLWPRASDDYGIEHYEIWIDNQFYQYSSVNAVLVTEDVLEQMNEIKVRSVDFTGKVSDWTVLSNIS